MLTGPPLLDALDRESHRIVGMICSETVPAAEIEGAIAALRSRTLAAFPERPRLFDELFARRFARLRTRFRPGSALFAGARPDGVAADDRAAAPADAARPPKAGGPSV